MSSTPVYTALTVGVIARRLDRPLHRVEYVISSRNIQPTAIAGNARVFSEADVDYIESELRRIDEERGELMLTPTGAAKKLNTSSKTVRSLILAGKLPAVDISTTPDRHRFRIDPEDLERFVETKFSPPPKARKRCRRRLPTVKEFV